MFGDDSGDQLERDREERRLARQQARESRAQTHTHTPI